MNSLGSVWLGIIKDHNRLFAEICREAIKLLNDKAAVNASGRGLKVQRIVPADKPGAVESWSLTGRHPDVFIGELPSVGDDGVE